MYEYYMQNDDVKSSLFAPIVVHSHEDGMRIDRWLRANCPQLSFGEVQKLLRSGQVRVDGKRAKGDYRLLEGNAVRVPQHALMPKGANDLHDAKLDKMSKQSNLIHQSIKKRTKTIFSAYDAWKLLSPMVIYDDEHFFVLNKSTSLAVQGGSGIDINIDSLLEALATENGDRPRLVHRLDQDTSGCLIVARTRPVAVKLTEHFRNRSVAKTYWCIVEGVPKPLQGRVNLPLKPYHSGNGEKKMMVCEHNDKDGQKAETLYSVVDKAYGKIAWISLKPVTGRTHQLRVHMMHLGTPIVGDRKYGSELHNDTRVPLHLHARRVQFLHPKTAQPIDITAPLPEHMIKTWDQYGLSIKDHNLN